MICMRTALVCSVLIVGLSPLVLADDIKVLFAPRTSAPPKIDGVLDEACWERAEAHDDFISLSGQRPERTVMRALHDATHLYLGIECDWRDPAALQRGVATIVSKHPHALAFVGIEQFVNTHGVEWFLDPGATHTSHYQILANAAGQICGQYKMDWNPFPEKPVFAARLSPKGWSAEFSLSTAALRQPALRLGDQWGFNAVRNDAMPAAIWKHVAPDFNTPTMFGLLVLGDYQTWWRQSVEATVARRFAEISSRLDSYQRADPQIGRMHAELQPLIKLVTQDPRYARIETRRDFVQSFAMYQKLNRLFGRLDDLCRTVDLLEKPLK